MKGFFVVILLVEFFQSLREENVCLSESRTPSQFEKRFRNALAPSRHGTSGSLSGITTIASILVSIARSRSQGKNCSLFKPDVESSIADAADDSTSSSSFSTSTSTHCRRCSSNCDLGLSPRLHDLLRRDRRGRLRLRRVRHQAPEQAREFFFFFWFSSSSFFTPFPSRSHVFLSKTSKGDLPHDVPSPTTGRVPLLPHRGVRLLARCSLRSRGESIRTIVILPLKTPGHESLRCDVRLFPRSDGDDMAPLARRGFRGRCVDRA